MISPELIRRYSFFGGLSHEHIIKLAQAATETGVEAGSYFFHEGDELNSFYLITEGEAAVVIEVPDRDVAQKVSGQLTGNLATRDVVISVVGPGNVIGWSALVPPFQATASAKATGDCRVAVFDAVVLRQAFEEDCRFGYVMMQRAAQVSSARLRDMRIETLAYLAEG